MVINKQFIGQNDYEADHRPTPKCHGFIISSQMWSREYRSTTGVTGATESLSNCFLVL